LGDCRAKKTSKQNLGYIKDVLRFCPMLTECGLVGQSFVTVTKINLDEILPVRCILLHSNRQTNSPTDLHTDGHDEAHRCLKTCMLLHNIRP
jgi:hypothetical protein